MCFIIIKTNMNKIHMYNFMGDYIALFDGSIFKQINSKMR
jgi:hypothetical protein